MTKEERNIYYKKYNRIKSHTKLGWIDITYNTQKGSSRKRKHNLPDYSKEELFEWVKLQTNFEELWKNWVDSDYHKDLFPSIDRINDDKPYTFTNIQLMTWEENKGKRKIEIYSFNKTNNRIIYFESMIEASIYYNVNYGVVTYNIKSNNTMKNLEHIQFYKKKQYIMNDKETIQERDR